MIKRYLLPGIFCYLLGSSPVYAESWDSNEQFDLFNKQLEIALNPIDRQLNFNLTSFTKGTEFAFATDKIIANLPHSLPTSNRAIDKETIEKGDYQRSASLLAGVTTTDTSLNQVTNVSQLRDVAPDDWAYEALRGLVNRYGCIAGFPDQTFRGSQSLSRYEFAAGLNSCLQQIERLIAASEAVAKEDLDTVNRLTQEFETELATIAGRVDSLEGRISFLEDHQFSTTTIFNGEVIFGIADAFGGNPPGGCSFVESQIAELTGVDERVDCSDAGEPETETTFTYLARLGLETSFTGKDRLRTYLTTGNFDNGGYTAPESLNTYMARLSYQADLDNQVILDLVEYRVPVFSDNVVVSVIPFGFSLSNVLSANSPYFDTGRGAISRFAEESPIFRLGGVLDAGAGIDWKILEEVRLQVAYGTGDSGDPDGGIFGADRSSLGVQLLLQPTESVVTGLTYVNSYTNDGRLGTYTGSVNAESGGLWSGGLLPNSNITEGDAIALGDLPAQTNAVGGTLQWRITEKLTFGAWGGWTFTEFKDEVPEFSSFAVEDSEGNRVILDEPRQSESSGKKPFADTITYLFSLGLADPLGREGDLFAFMFGMPPKLVDAGPETQGASVPFFETSRRGEDDIEVTDNNPSLDDNIELENWFKDNFGKKDEATSLHFEFFYRFKVNDNIFITPGFFFVTNPGHIENNDTLYVGTIRTTFRF